MNVDLKNGGTIVNQFDNPISSLCFLRTIRRFLEELGGGGACYFVDEEAFFVCANDGFDALVIYSSYWSARLDSRAFGRDVPFALPMRRLRHCRRCVWFGCCRVVVGLR